MKFYVLADEDIVMGFAYAGIEGEIVKRPEDSLEAFEKAIKITDLGILIVTEQIADTIHDRLLEWQLESSYPLIVEIPSMEESELKRPGLTEMVREAVGIHI
jgi:vacuolar-type H+-ATPase subunit F/Vma7